MAKVVVPLWCMSGSFMIFFIFKAGCGGLGGLRFCRENPNPDFRIQKRILRFWGANPKTIMNPLNPDSGRILRIKPKSGFLRFTIWASFWDWIWKKYFWRAVFRKKKWYATGAVHVWHSNWTYVGGALFLNPLTCHVFCTYVVSAYAGLFSK